MTEINLISLRKSLPVGYGNKIHVHLASKYSIGYIYQVVNGTKDNSEIIDAAIQLGQKTISKIQHQNNLIRNL